MANQVELKVDLDPKPMLTMLQKYRDIFQEAYQSVSRFLRGEDRAVSEVDSWDGSAGQWDTAEAYCSACLIDVNSAAGNTEKKKEYCKLPVKAPGSSSYADKGVMAAAGSHGIQAVKKPEGVSDEDWNAAVKKAANKIISLYGEMDKDCPDAVYKIAGKEVPERAISMPDVYDQLWEMSYNSEQNMWPLDVYIDNDGSYYAVFMSGGKLYRASMTVLDGAIALGEMTEVQIQHVPRSFTKIFKSRADEKDLYRWVSVSCAAVLNKSGELDSRALFDSFEENFDPEHPPFRDFFHLGEQFRVGTMDFVGRDDYMLITSGIYDDSELAQMEIKARMENPDYWGDSTTFYPTAEPEMLEVGDGIKIPVYTQGVLHSVATLPVKDGASLFLRGTVKEVNRMAMSDRAYEAFLALFGGDEDKAKKWLSDNVDPQNRAVIEGIPAGLIARETDPEPPKEETSAPEIPNEGEFNLEATDEFIGRVADLLFSRIEERLTSYGVGVESLQSQVEELTAKVDALTALAPRLETLETQVKETHRIWKEDLPAGKVVLSLNRPRSSPPKEEPPVEPEIETSADIAERTLSAIARY